MAQVCADIRHAGTEAPSAVRLSPLSHSQSKCVCSDSWSGRVGSRAYARGMMNGVGPRRRSKTYEVEDSRRRGLCAVPPSHLYGASTTNGVPDHRGGGWVGGRSEN